MKHTRTITTKVSMAALDSPGTYLILAGQILGVVAALFMGKEIFGPDPEDTAT